MTQTKHLQRYHIVYSLHIFKKGLIFCLVPLVQALLAFDLPSLYTALRQEALILALLAALSLLVWRCTGWQQDSDKLLLRAGVLVRRQRTVRRSELAVVEVARPLWLRTMGAAKLTLYMARSGAPGGGTVSLYLPRKAAESLAEELLPLPRHKPLFKPTGAAWLGFVMVSANLISTGLLLWVSIQQTGELLGQDVTAPLWNNLDRLEQIAEAVLPAGLAWIFTVGFLLWGVSLMLSFFRTAGFTVGRSGGVILCQGGFLSLTERRILAAAVTACDVRTTPVARLLRMRPVYLSAGSYKGGDIPVLVYRKGHEHLLDALMPGFCMPPRRTENIIGRSLPTFIIKSGLIFLVSFALTCVSAWKLPQITGLLAIPCALSAAAVLVAYEGFFMEGVSQNPGRTLGVQYCRAFTRHSMCIFTQNLSVRLYTTPFAETVGRCNLTIGMPCGQKVTVRSMNHYRARHLPIVY